MIDNLPILHPESPSIPNHAASRRFVFPRSLSRTVGSVKPLIDEIDTTTNDFSANAERHSIKVIVISFTVIMIYQSRHPEVSGFFCAGIV